MPKKGRKKLLYRRKRERMNETEDAGKYDINEQKINRTSPDESKQTAVDVIFSPPKDFIVDVASQSTSISTLTTSDKSSNLIGEIKTVSAAKNMANSLETLPSSDQQPEAFEIAMRNNIFCSFVNR